MPVISVVSVMIVLGILSWMDIRKQELWLVIIWGMGIFGVFLYVWKRPFSPFELWGGMGVGAIVLLVAMISKEAIGKGDGWLLCVTGIYMGLWQNIKLLMLAAIMAAVVSIVFVIIRKCRIKDQIPFVPCLLSAFCFMLVRGGIYVVS